MRRVLPILLLLGAAAGCSALPQAVPDAAAPATDGNPALLQRQVVAAQERSARLEVQTSQLAEQVKTLGTVIREIQGQQGRLEEQIERLRREMLASKPAPSPAPPRPAGPGRGAPSPPAGRLANLSPENAYNTAYRAMREKKSQEAVALFREFLVRHPRSALSANAQYWLGEVLYDLKEYTPALEAFGKVLQQHPSSRKVPDAIYMSGLIHLRMNDPRQAALQFEKLIERFPRHSLTEKAKSQLRTLHQSGNNIHR